MSIGLGYYVVAPEEARLYGTIVAENDHGVRSPLLVILVNDIDCKDHPPTHRTIAPQNDTGKKNHNDRNDRVAYGRERHIVIWKTCTGLPMRKACIFSSTE